MSTVPSTPVPVPNGFVYTRVLETLDQVNADESRAWCRTTKEYWLSTDGRSKGLWREVDDRTSDNPAGRPDHPTDLFPIDACPGPVVDDPWEVGNGYQYCPGPGYVEDFPTDPAGALAYLRQGRRWNGWTPFSDGGSEDRKATDYEVALNIGALFPTHRLRPESWVAIREALVGPLGGTLLHEAWTATGRTGVAVALRFPMEQRCEFIFDPQTYEMIGIRDVMTSDEPGLTKLLDNARAVVETAVVDAPGVYPDGSMVTKIQKRENEK